MLCFLKCMHNMFAGLLLFYAHKVLAVRTAFCLYAVKILSKCKCYDRRTDSGVARGDDGGGPPRAALLGAAKLKLHLKIWGREEITQRMEEKVVKNLWGNRQKKPGGGAANLGSVPGGRHPSYATAHTSNAIV